MVLVVCCLNLIGNQTLVHKSYAQTIIGIVLTFSRRYWSSRGNLGSVWHLPLTISSSRTPKL
uniref:Uncharacterized protein n=1 Tax=Arundo donax TaxID=35708 RepID=A0A0A9H8I1_ARUDO